MVSLVRIALLSFVVTLIATACSGDQSPDPTTTPEVRIVIPTATLMPTPEPSQTPTPTPQPPALELVSNLASQGGLLLVRLINPPPASEVTARFAGSSYPMLPEGERWFAVIGLAIEFPPGDYSIEIVADGEAVAAAGLSVAAGAFPQESIELPPETASLLADAAAIEQERRLLASVYAGFTAARLWSGAWVLPAQGAITNPFGLMRSINGGPFSPHTGTDVAAEAGLPVVAAASGRVAFAGPLYLRGNSVIIDHGAGVFSGYHHLSEIQVTAGQEVTQGQQIGLVGATGLAGGPHLHWEAIVGGVRVDPTFWTYAPIEP